MLKKAMSSLAVRRFVQEASTVEGAFFQKAYQLDYDTLVIRMAARKTDLEGFHDVPGSLSGSLLGSSNPGEADRTDIELGEQEGNYVRFDLYIKMGGFMFISPKIDAEMPKEPSPYAMKLRKSLSNRILEDISQVGIDRVVVLTFRSGPGEEPGRLYIELFGDGNAILVRGDTIEAPFTSRSWSSRTVKRGETFSPPPSGLDPKDLDQEGMADLIEDTKEDLVHFLIRRCNLPPQYAEEVCLRTGLDKSRDMKGLEKEERMGVLENIGSIMEDVEREEGGFVHYIKGRPRTIEPVLLYSVLESDPSVTISRLEGDRERRNGNFYVHTDTINDAFREFMYDSSAPVPPEERKKEKGVKRLKKLLKSQEKALKEKRKDVGTYRSMADSLYLDYVRLSSILEKFDPDSYPKDPEAHPEIKDFSPSGKGGGYIEVDLTSQDGEAIEVSLDISMDVNGNAERLYELSKKAKRKADGVEKAISKTKERIEESEKEAQDMEESREENVREKKLRKFWFEDYRWCFSSEGILMVGGRDARSNERLVKKYLRDSDLYAHADLSGAPSVVLRIEKDQEAAGPTLEQGVHLSLLHSKAWSSRIGSGGGYWVLPDQVSRTPQSGEFLAKGSFIIRGKKNFVDKLPMEGAVGILYVEGVPKVMFGPLQAVRENCQGTIFIVRPGRKKKSDVAKMIARELGGEQDQVLSVLPPGEMEAVRLRSSSSSEDNS